MKSYFSIAMILLISNFSEAMILHTSAEEVTVKLNKNSQFTSNEANPNQETSNILGEKQTIPYKKSAKRKSTPRKRN